MIGGEFDAGVEKRERMYFYGVVPREHLAYSLAGVSQVKSYFWEIRRGSA